MTNDHARRLVILADGLLNYHNAKTALGILRYGRDPVVAVIDRANAGRDCADVVGVGRGVPIVASLADALLLQPETLVIGIALRGGGYPAEWTPVLIAAMAHGLHIESGLHQFLSDIPELAATAAAHQVRITDVRRPPVDRTVALGRPHRPGSRTVLAVGSDCAVGKMSASLEIEIVARQRGLHSTFVATGQTGIMIWGDGVPLDAVVGDFMAGAVETLTLRAAESADLVLVEGQGALLHPGYSGVTLSLLHGSRPDAFILCHVAGLTMLDDDQYDVRIPPLSVVAAMYEAAASWTQPERRIRVVGVALNTFRLDEAAARAAIDATEHEMGVPTTDPVRFGAAPLLEAILRVPPCP